MNRFSRLKVSTRASARRAERTYVEVLFKVLHRSQPFKELVERLLILVYTNVERLHVEFLYTAKLDVVGKVLQNLGELCCFVRRKHTSQGE